MLKVAGDMPRRAALGFMNFFCTELFMPSMDHKSIQLRDVPKTASIEDALSWQLLFLWGDHINAAPNADFRTDFIKPALRKGIAEHNRQAAIAAGVSERVSAQKIVLEIAEKSERIMQSNGMGSVRLVPNFDGRQPEWHKQALRSLTEQMGDKFELQKAVSDYVVGLRTALEASARVAAGATVFLDDREFFNHRILSQQKSVY